MRTAAPGPALFVATDLDSFETDTPEVLAEDVTVSGRCYRRLDPAYYAWLRRQVALAKKALDGGKLAAAVFDSLRVAFNAVHAWAVKHLGEAALLAAAAREVEVDQARSAHGGSFWSSSSGCRAYTVEASILDSVGICSDRLPRLTHGRPKPQARLGLERNQCW